MGQVYRVRWGRLAVLWVGLVGVIVGTSILLAGGSAHAVEFSDLEVVHKTLIAEAGSDGVMGMVAVANVIRNRARERNISVEAVCLQRWQFSCWNEGKARVDAFIRKNRAVWDDALTAWQVSGTEDITGGANMYYNPKLCSPKWGRLLVRVTNIGGHRFGYLNK